MILLDTNVLSEPLRPAGDPKVMAWLDAQNIATLYLSTISLAELQYGIAALPVGKRRTDLWLALETRLLPLFTGRILVFDAKAAKTYAHIRASARSRGRAIAPADGFIAAIAAAHELTVATRDTSPFEAAGIPIIDPWTTTP